MTTPPRTTDSRNDSPALLLKVQAEALSRIAKGFASALDKVDDVLFDFLQKSHGTEQQHYADAMREVRRSRARVEADLIAHLESAFNAVHQGDPLQAEDTLVDQAPGALSLVSEDMLESQIAARMLSATVHRDHATALAALDQRLGWVAGRIKLDEETNPLGPAHIGVGVHAAFRGLDIEPAARLVLFKLIERELGPTLAAVYDQANRRLVEAGVLPHLHRQADVQRPAPRAAPPRRPVEDERAGLQDDGLAGHPGDEHQPPIHQARPATGGGRPLDASEQALFSTLSQMLQTWRADHVPATSRRPQPEDARPLSSPEMLSVLSLLQPEVPMGVRLAIDDPNQSITQRLKTELLASAERLGVNPEQACLSPMDEDAIDLVGMLFDVLLDERDLVGPGRNLLGRLVVPYIKVALLDRRMFLRKTHPARRLLNSLAEACEGNQGETPHDRALLSKAEEVVERLLADFNENVAIFKTLEEEFRSFLDQHRKRVELAEKRTAEAQRGQERLESARTAALSALAERAGDRELRPVMETVLRRYWVHHLTVVALRHGEASPQYEAALRAADLLVSCVDASAAGSASLDALLSNLDSALAPILASSGTTGEAASELVRVLERELSGKHDDLRQAGAEEAAEQSAAAAVVAGPADASGDVAGQARERDAEAVPGLRLVSNRDELEFDPADADRVRALAIGTWVEFVGEDGSVQPAKLSWQSPISSRLLFVNRRGGRLCVASAEELAAMMRQDRLRIRAVNTAFERAMHQVLGKLKESGQG